MRTLNSINKQDLLKQESINYRTHASLSMGSISLINGEYVLIARLRKNADSLPVLFKVVNTNFESTKETLNDIRTHLFVNNNTPEWIATHQWHGSRIEVLPEALPTQSFFTRLLNWIKSLGSK